MIYYYCFEVLVNYYFQVFFGLKVILSMVKMTQNGVTELSIGRSCTSDSENDKLLCIAKIRLRKTVTEILL